MTFHRHYYHDHISQKMSTTEHNPLPPSNDFQIDQLKAACIQQLFPFYKEARGRSALYIIKAMLGGSLPDRIKDEEICKQTSTIQSIGLASLSGSRQAMLGEPTATEAEKFCRGHVQEVHTVNLNFRHQFYDFPCKRSWFLLFLYTIKLFCFGS